MRPITEKLKIEARTGDMTRAKKILFLRCIGLTGCLSSGIMPIVKTQEYNSLTNNKQTDKPAELRDSDVRTAFLSAAHLCWSICFFCAHGTEMGIL